MPSLISTAREEPVLEVYRGGAQYAASAKTLDVYATSTHVLIHNNQALKTARVAIGFWTTCPSLKSGR